jgi:ferric-dicitrate binding protein FerR (iron transport regulator)
MNEKTRNILLNKSSEAEREAFYTELQHNPAEESDFKKTFFLYAISRIFTMKTSASRKEKMFRTFWSRATARKTRTRKLVIAGQAAAIVLLMIYTASSIHDSLNRIESYTVKSQKGSVSSSRINEGAEMWLNTSSSAEVTKKGEKQIIVDLNGEGYFEVEHNPEREFIVKLGNFQLRDIGTSFNIKAYPDEHKLIISVFDGEAHLETSDDQLLKTLKRGEEIEVDLQTGAMTLKASDYLSDIDWKDGKFSFEQTPFSEILEEFEEWYDVEFTIKKEEVKDLLFTGVLKRKTSIENLMNILKLTSDFEYEIKIKSDGSSLVSIY